MDKKDLDAIEALFDKKFLEIEGKLEQKIDTKFEELELKLYEKMDARFEELELKLCKKMDARFEELELKLYEKMDAKFEDFKSQFSSELADVLHDMMVTIDNRFNKMESYINQRFEIQDKKIDLLLEYSKDNLQKHDIYDRTFSKIDSKLLNHDLRLNSLEALSTSTAI